MILPFFMANINETYIDKDKMYVFMDYSTYCMDTVLFSMHTGNLSYIPYKELKRIDTL